MYELIFCVLNISGQLKKRSTYEGNGGNSVQVQQKTSLVDINFRKQYVSHFYS
jgi:hypothetical protein